MSDLVKNMMGFDTFIREKFGDPLIWCHTRPVQQNYANMWKAWQARVPEGYVVVPKEPTYEMIDAAIGNNGHIESIYRDMIKTAENEK